MFDTNLPTFVTGKDIGGGFNDGKNNSWELTLPELFSLLMGGNAGIHSGYKYEGEGGIGGVLKRNIETNGMTTAIQLVTIPMAFKVARKLLAKPLINPANRMLKQIGITEVKL